MNDASWYDHISLRPACVCDLCCNRNAKTMLSSCMQGIRGLLSSCVHCIHLIQPRQHGQPFFSRCEMVGDHLLWTSQLAQCGYKRNTVERNCLGMCLQTFRGRHTVQHLPNDEKGELLAESLSGVWFGVILKSLSRFVTLCDAHVMIWGFCNWTKFTLSNPARLSGSIFVQTLGGA